MQNLKKTLIIYPKDFLPWKHNQGIFNQNAYILIFHLHLKNINKGDYTALGYFYQSSTSENSNNFFKKFNLMK